MVIEVDLTKTVKTLLFILRLRLWCCACSLLLVSKLPAECSIHPIILSGFNLNKRKTIKTEGRVKLAWAMLSFILFSQELQNHRPSVSKTRDCEFNIKGRFWLLSVFTVFLCWCLSREAVCDSFGSEGKLACMRWWTDWKRMGIAHEQQQRVFKVFFYSSNYFLLVSGSYDKSGFWFFWGEEGGMNHLQLVQTPYPLT